MITINDTMVIVSDDFTFHAVLVNNAYLTPSVIAHEANAMTEKSIDVTIYLKFILFSDVA